MSRDHKSDSEWQRQQGILMDPPGTLPTARYLASLDAINSMREIEEAAA
jgi:hypothetical protein